MTSRLRFMEETRRKEREKMKGKEKGSWMSWEELQVKIDEKGTK